MTIVKTDTFKEHMQAIVEDATGVKISKEKAWGFFKDVINGTVQFVLTQKDHRLPLAGIGNFEILKTKPRKSKAGLDKDGKRDPKKPIWPFVPRFRFYPSVSIDKLVEFFFGLGDHEGVKTNDYGIYKRGTKPATPSVSPPIKKATPKVKPTVAVSKPVPKDAFDDEL